MVKNNFLMYDLHVHSVHSRDSISRIEDIIKTAKKRLDGVAITDHDAIGGAKKAKKIAKKHNVEVICGEEVTTDKGHVLALFINEKIMPGRFEEVLESIKMQGGIACLAHPYRKIKRPDYNELKKLDAVETVNSKNMKFLNKKALHIAEELKLAKTGGSDAHTPFDIGYAYTIVKDDLYKELKTGRTLAKGTTKFWIPRKLREVLINLIR